MLVLFIYVASLASNESFKFSFFGVVVGIVAVVVSFFIFLVDRIIVSTKLKIRSCSLSVGSNVDLRLVGIIYRKPVISFTLYIVLYLLLTLFVIVKITGTYFGPLRLSTYDYTFT